MNSYRTSGLEAVIYYKLFIAGLLAAAAIALLSTSYTPSKIEVIADSSLFETHFWLIDQGLDRILNLNSTSMRFCGLATGVYAALILVQAIGLRQNRAWAKIVVLLTAGISLPVEVYELVRRFTLLKLGLLLANLLIFGYFWHYLKLGRRWRSRRVNGR